jgi:hypothetical protein
LQDAQGGTVIAGLQAPIQQQAALGQVQGE